VIEQLGELKLQVLSFEDSFLGWCSRTSSFFRRT
jgi:hypothetical protein